MSHGGSAPFVLANTAGWAYCLPFYFAVGNVTPLGAVDFAAVGVYLLGTFVHFGADYQKRRFKLNPDSSGRLLDTGFWSISRHPNYFGDFIIYVSFAIDLGSRRVVHWNVTAHPTGEWTAQQMRNATWAESPRRLIREVPATCRH